MTTELKYAIVKDGIVGSKLPNDLVVDRNWLQEVLFDGLSSDLERTVFIDHPSDRRWNARQVRDMSLKMATALDRIGLSKGKSICSYLPNNDYHALWQYGIYMAASVFVGCYWTNPYRELLHYATVSQADAILCSKENLGTAKQVADALLSIKCLIVVDLDGNCDERETYGGKPIHSHSQLLKIADGGELLSQPLTIEGDPKSTPASIHFSSGSTGPRKGVVRSHSNFTFILASQTPWSERGLSCTMSLHVPIAHTSGGTSTLRGAAGMTLVVSESFILSTFLEAVQKHRIQMAILAPSALSEMVKNSATCAKYNLSSLVHVVVGGAPLTDALKGPAAQVVGVSTLKQAYGSTETDVVTSCPKELDNLDTVGCPAVGCEIKIVHPDTGELLGCGQVGEALVRSPSISPGYYNNPEVTAKSLTKDGFFKTGDAMYYDSDGLFYIVDRYKDILKVGMSQVAPSELESLLLQCEEVKEAAVIGISDDHLGAIPKAYVVIDDTFTQNESLRKKLIDHVDRNVSEWKTLKGGLEFISEIPKISFGKIDKPSLRKRHAQLDKQ